jgi:hypothetical protein
MSNMVPIIAASAAAAGAQRRMEEEEEKMTGYSINDLENDWEFKVVRANREVFRSQEELAKLVSEEKRAGWVLLEKFDDSRIRFKRQRAMQARDEQLRLEGIDPYRTQYGMSLTKFKLMIAAAALAFAFVLMAGIVALSSSPVKP